MPRKPAPSLWHNAITRYSDEPPGSLLANPQNWRLHPKEQTAALTGSLTEIGWISPIIVNETTSHVVDGHARIGEAIARGEPTVPVAYVNLTEDQERLALATFDPIAAMAGTDQRMLDDLLSSLTTNDDGLSDLLASLASEQPKALNPDDADLTPPTDPITRPGDLWLLGEHRLLCGDATKTEDVARLMGDENASLCLTDPPYNVGIDYGERVDDEQARQHYLAWLRSWFEIACRSATCQVVTVGMVNLSLWIRDIAEPVWVCAWRKVNQCSPSGLRGFNTWEPLLVYGRSPRIPHDSWDIPVAQAAVEGFPVAKTVEAWSAFVESFSALGDTVLDLFLGSGTTLITAEQLGRRCYAMEIEPAYCDVSVRRWEHVTGKQAQRG